MNLSQALADLRVLLTATFAAVDTWFDQPAAVLDYLPADGGWSVAEVLVHLALTNRYLLVLIEKGTAKALRNTQGRELAVELAAWQPPQRLAAIGVLHAFAWERPAHMEPRTHPQPLPATRQQLHAQLHQALACLDRLAGGEGVLYQTTMTVNDLGKLNVYEYLYFLGQHARRHLTQLADNAAELVAGGQPAH